MGTVDVSYQLKAVQSYFLIQNFCDDSNTRKELFHVRSRQSQRWQRNSDDLHAWNLSISEFSDFMNFVKQNLIQKK